MAGLKKRKASKTRLHPQLEKLEKHLRLKDGTPLPHPLESFDYLVGIDEVGIACTAGPVVAGAFLYSPRADWVSTFGASRKKSERPPRIHDSKQLKIEEREVAARFLAGLEGSHAVTAESTVEEIDRINIYWAARLAMRRCLEKLAEKVPELKTAKTLILVDGSHPLKGVSEMSAEWICHPIVKGDAKVFPVAAASIVAKEMRDKFMVSLAREFPGYGWETNVGYPTPVHRAALRSLGATSWHRRSFDLQLQVDFDFDAEGPESELQLSPADRKNHFC